MTIQTNETIEKLSSLREKFLDEEKYEDAIKVSALMGKIRKYKFKYDIITNKERYYFNLVDIVVPEELLAGV